MNKELAKELKDAGFPQELKNWDVFYLTKGDEEGVAQVVSGYETDSGAYGPSLGDYGIKLGWGSIEDVEELPFGSPLYAKAPTLEELIEACGAFFMSLERWTDGWYAEAYRSDLTEDIGPQVGKTPIEAVARLWLALNKK